MHCSKGLTAEHEISDHVRVRVSHHDHATGQHTREHPQHTGRVAHPRGLATRQRAARPGLG
eukprot:6346024-Amphidinium_carterae.1